MILISMMVLCTQVNEMYVIATVSVHPHRTSLKYMPGHARHIFQAYPVWMYTHSSNYIQHLISFLANL